MGRTRRKRRRLQGGLSDISLTPLIDTALTLLIIFMIATPMLQSAIRVNLPRGSSQEAKNERQELIVYVDGHNKLFFNGAECQSDDILTCIKRNVREDEKKSVFVKADKAALCGNLFELVDQIKHVGGVQSVVFCTQKRA